MADEIKKLKFKRNTDLQIEVVSLRTLTAVSKYHLIKPHRTNFYHIFLFENCQPTHFVDFEPIKIAPYSILFIDKDRVHMLDWYFKQTTHTVWLGTSPKTRAETFYRKSGWTEIGTHGNGEIKFKMTYKDWTRNRIEHKTNDNKSG